MSTASTDTKDLKPSQIETLRFADQHPHITMPQLAKHVEIRSTSARSRIGHLLQGGYLKSKNLTSPKQKQKRGDAKLGFAITPKGKAAIKLSEKAPKVKTEKTRKAAPQVAVQN